ncbi:MAG: 1-acyl-sn-glycerol-3-phosphate acyltransferase [Chloroflexi bacterium]|nr:1-acyl-sn-glycerol-3-phosphate acyltransferase [Chloroflexota bacterium]
MQQTEYPTPRELMQALSLEIWKVIGLSPDTRLRHLLNPLLWAPLRRFAEWASEFDRMVAESGFREAAREVLPRFVNRLEVEGQQQVPASGPLLVVSNHPGSADGLAIAASLPRNDLKIVVSALPFIRSLPNSAQHFIYTDPLEPHKRMEVIRSSIRHLRNGGALLLFPRGKVEPDPAWLPGAMESLSRWSASLGLIARAVPEAKILTTVVSGVLARGSLHNPVTRWPRDPRRRQLLAEIFQVIQQALFPYGISVSTRLSYGKPIVAGDQDARELTREIVEYAKQLLNDHLTPAGGEKWAAS